jgi:hypothetical protein
VTPAACIVQIPFPSTTEPYPPLAAYYRRYEERFRSEFPEFFVPAGALWEVPLWVAHITALLDEVGMESRLCDLSCAEADVTSCVQAITDATQNGDFVLISPLAQNFALALKILSPLRAAGRRIVVGGNMAPLVPAEDVHAVHLGQLDRSFLSKLLQAEPVTIRSSRAAIRGRVNEPITWAPNYRHLDHYEGQVPLLRVNASHGCLYNCSFCGDAWSHQLTIVDRRALASEVAALRERFPATRLVYIGDKTFGQSFEAVNNLIDVFAPYGDEYEFIAQTHVLQVTERVIDAMVRLGVRVVELGFESADTAMLKSLDKLSHGLNDYSEKLAQLSRAGIKVVINVMGGLDAETEASHRSTTEWMEGNHELVWLFNLYNFVPYPLSPDFPRLRSRIFNWDFSAWREDAPPVYTPKHLTPARSWELFGEKVDVATKVVGRVQPWAAHGREAVVDM